jgi:hypothetical protein
MDSAEKEENDTKITEKKVNNKIKINPTMKEAVENLGGELLEMVEIEEKITDKTDMGAAIRDFRASKSPQLAGRTKEQRRQAAIAAVLTARRGGKKLGEAVTASEITQDQNQSQKKTSDTQVFDRQKLQNMRIMQQKQQMLQRQKLNLQKQGKMPLNTEEFVDEATADDALAIMRNKVSQKHGAAAIVGSDANKKAQAAQLQSEKPKRKLQGYSIPGAPKEKSYND